MSDEYIREKFKLAIDKLYLDDYSLIQRKCSERSIVFRLGLYLAKEFNEQDIDVDCEYNKNGDSPKSLINKRFNFPDIIIHKRYMNDCNYLIAEVKTSNDTNKNHFENDKIKLEGFTREIPYSYRQGAHIFISSTKCRIVWYMNDQIIYNAFYVCKRNKCLYPEDLNVIRNRCAFDKWYFDTFNVLVDHGGLKSR